MTTVDKIDLLIQQNQMLRRHIRWQRRAMLGLGLIVTIGIVMGAAPNKLGLVQRVATLEKTIGDKGGLTDTVKQLQTTVDDITEGRIDFPRLRLKARDASGVVTLSVEGAANTDLCVRSKNDCYYVIRPGPKENPSKPVIGFWNNDGVLVKAFGFDQPGVSELRTKSLVLSDDKSSVKIIVEAFGIGLDIDKKDGGIMRVRIDDSGTIYRNVDGGWKPIAP